jgi:hypothetical protein
MTVFGTILSSIFGSTPAQAAPQQSSQPDNTSPTPIVVPSVPMPSAGNSSTTSGELPKVTAPAVDIAAILDAKANAKAEDLDWRRSIVDLMKILDLDSSLGKRRELATELGFTGDMKNSASMNVWLHKQVMARLAENGGFFPKEAPQLKRA